MPNIHCPPHLLRLTSLFVIFSALVPGAALAQSVDVGSSSLPLRGPLPVRDYEPTNALFLLPLPTQATVLARKKATIDMSVDIPNNFLIAPRAGYYADFEDQRINVGYTRGLGGGSELSVRVPYVLRNGGITDGLISGWHQAFHISGAGRRNIAKNLFHFDLFDAQTGKIVIQSRSSVSGLGDIVFEYRRSLTPGIPGFDPRTGAPDPRRVTLAARVLLKVPSGSASDLLGSGGTDIGVGVVASARPFRRVAFHGNLTSVWLGKTGVDALRNRSTLIHSLIAVEWLLNGRTSFVTQIDDNPAPMKTGSEYVDRPRRQFSFGFWRQTTTRQNLFVSLGENDFGWAANQAPDLQLAAGTRLSL